MALWPVLRLFKRALEKDGQESNEDKFIKGVIIEDEMEDMIMGGRDFHEVEDTNLKETAKNF